MPHAIAPDSPFYVIVPEKEGRLQPRRSGHLSFSCGYSCGHGSRLAVLHPPGAFSPPVLDGQVNLCTLSTRCSPVLARLTRLMSETTGLSTVACPQELSIPVLARLIRLMLETMDKSTFAVLYSMFSRVGKTDMVDARNDGLVKLCTISTQCSPMLARLTWSMPETTGLSTFARSQLNVLPCWQD
jgi:hypothetical protein